MKYNVIISNKANQLIKRHLAIIVNVSKSAAKKQSEEFKSAIKRIGENPKMFPAFEEEFIKYGKYRKCVVSKTYIIIFQVKEDMIYIDYVIDTRSDYSWLIR